jgi:hypothetical protein
MNSLPRCLEQQQATVKPSYERLVAIMTPAAHMPVVRVDSDNDVPK